jgi:hypothetical protein
MISRIAVYETHERVIPVFGFLYGAGAIVGAMGGLDLGIAVGGLATILVHLGVKKEEVIKYEEHIKAGHFLLEVKGTKKDVDRVENILYMKNKPAQLV